MRLGAEHRALAQALEIQQVPEAVELVRVMEEARRAEAPEVQVISKARAVAQVLAADPVRVLSPALLFKAPKTPRLMAKVNLRSPSNRRVATV